MRPKRHEGTNARRQRGGRRRRGVTLLEIILSTALLVPLLGVMFWFYSSTMESGDRSAGKVRDVQLARVIVDRIVRELRQSTGFSSGYGTGIFGTRHQISINTVVIPDKALVERRGIRDSERPGQFDLRQVDYYVAWDEVNTDEEGNPRALGLMRRERRTFNQLKPVEEAPEEPAEGDEPEMPDAEGLNGVGEELPEGLTGEEIGEGVDRPHDRGGPGNVSGDPFGKTLDELLDDSFDEELDDEQLEGAKQELYAPELKFIEFFYHDGNRWWDSWEIKQGNALPQMVMVTVGYVPELPEDEEIDIMKDLLRDEEDLEPVPADRYMFIVRIPQADTFFASRLQREASSLASLEGLE